jgi:hypothetical protein
MGIKGAEYGCTMAQGAENKIDQVIPSSLSIVPCALSLLTKEKCEISNDPRLRIVFS